jgi:hypothetical protein
VWIPESGVLEDTFGLKNLYVTCCPKEFYINSDFKRLRFLLYIISINDAELEHLAALDIPGGLLGRGGF